MTSNEKQKFQGNEDEVAGMIRKLNAMNINDPEYAPIYYKVMVLDQSGIAEKCVKPPFVEKSERPRSRTPAGGNTMSNERNSMPATYLNNIPLGSGSSGSGGNKLKCYGCLGDGHQIFECRQIADLVQKNIIVFNDETRRLTMKNGNQIRRMPGESLVKAAERIAGSNAPHVMFGIVDRSFDRKKAVQNFYQAENRRTRIEEVSSEEDSSEDSRNLESDKSLSEDSENGEVYLTKPQKVYSADEPFVQHTDRTLPSTRTARKQSFDGVYPPRRENVKARVVRDLQEEKLEPGMKSEAAEAELEWIKLRNLAKIRENLRRDKINPICRRECQK
ncbi:hypothetical protein FB451DRAFT_1188621 [Mycena latifolia]|nr:hypothetical protein FB451DRAFT_1188621 [Mycena latifolia]